MKKPVIMEVTEHKKDQAFIAFLLLMLANLHENTGFCF
jgi:hypothetical protein